MDLGKALSELPLPKLFVFDLDYTLWPFWCDTHVVPPFHRNKKGTVTDKCKFPIVLYKEVLDILQALKEAGCLLAAASRTHTPDIAEELLHLLDIGKYFDFKEIYPGSKVKHFKKFQESSGIQYEEMIFYDDEQRNKNVEIGKLGVTTQYVNNGLTIKDVINGINSYRTNLQLLFSKKLDKK